MSLQLAKVVASHPETYSVDLVFLSSGQRAPKVQVLSWSASTNSGHVDLPPPTPPAQEYGDEPTKDRDIYAVVGFTGQIPVVMGFLFPQACQMLFEDAERTVSRHASDWYTTVDGAGSFEAYHPSGTYLRVGENPAHEDLTGRDRSRKWKIARNTDKAVHVRLSVANAGDEVARFEITPDGDVSVQCDGDLTADVDGDATVALAGDADVTVHGDASVTVYGSITSSAQSWTHTGPIEVHGNVVVVDGDVTADGKSLKTHAHTGVTAGPGTSGPPA